MAFFTSIFIIKNPRPLTLTIHYVALHALLLIFIEVLPVAYLIFAFHRPFHLNPPILIVIPPGSSGRLPSVLSYDHQMAVGIIGPVKPIELRWSPFVYLILFFQKLFFIIEVRPNF